MLLEVEHLRDERSTRNFEQAGEFYRVLRLFMLLNLVNMGTLLLLQLQ
jgi:hypothetical protein